MEAFSFVLPTWLLNTLRVSWIYFFCFKWWTMILSYPVEYHLFVKMLIFWWINFPFTPYRIMFGIKWRTFWHIIKLSLQFIPKTANNKTFMMTQLLDTLGSHLVLMSFEMPWGTQIVECRGRLKHQLKCLLDSAWVYMVLICSFNVPVVQFYNPWVRVWWL